MNRSFCVIVLCPNGRRETVKVTLNSSILQVLEEACEKQNINPEDYDIRHYNKTLDLSLPIRFANLPNNAQLELRPAANSRKDCLVTVGLQLESGERIMGDFSPSASVSDVLEQCLSSKSISLQEVGEPVCIYMRQKITDDALKTTTLRSLGLTKGTAMIRLLYRKPEELEGQAHVSSPLVSTTPTERTKSPYQDGFQPPDSPLPEQIRKLARLDDSLKVEKEIQTSKLEEDDCSNMDVDSNENSSLPITAAYSEKSFHHSEDRISDLTGNIATDSFDAKPKMECDSEIEEDTFEGIRDINYIGERHAVLYSLDDITDIKKADLPDDFFDLTINDAKYLMAEYRNQRKELENQPLLTKELRQRQILQKLAQYSETVIRVYFPERLVLQAVFDAMETVQTISDFVRNYIEDQSLNFYMYITPPKEKLNPSKTLLEAMLVPAAVIYFGCDTQCPSYLMENLRARLSDPRAAALAASESRKSSVSIERILPDIPCQNTNDTVVEEKVLQNVTPATNVSQHSANAQTKDTVPKWLKLSKK